MISGEATSRSGFARITTSAGRICDNVTVTTPCTCMTSQKFITAMMIPTVFSRPCSIALHSAELEILTRKGDRNAGMIGSCDLPITVRFLLSSLRVHVRSDKR